MASTGQHTDGSISLLSGIGVPCDQAGDARLDLARRHTPSSGAAENSEVCIDFLGCRARTHIRNTRHHLTKTSNYSHFLLLLRDAGDTELYECGKSEVHGGTPWRCTSSGSLYSGGAVGDFRSRRYSRFSSS